MIMDIVLASRNPKKIREMEAILSAHIPGIRILSLDDVGFVGDIEEDGTTYEENALIKATTAMEASGRRLAAIADDSGLSVDALGGAPGVYTARYAGEGKDFNANMDKVLYELGVLESEANMAAGLGLHTKPVSRRARFKSVITLIVDGKKHFFEGTLDGVIAREKSGNGGFGYDPIFIADEYPCQTLADITEEQKNEISHRGKALRAMAAWLKSQN